MRTKRNFSHLSDKLWLVTFRTLRKIKQSNSKFLVTNLELLCMPYYIIALDYYTKLPKSKKEY